MLIKNALVVLENEGKECDVRIRGERIERISQGLKEEKGEVVINAKDKILMPGVVDLHTHGSGGYDFMDGDKNSVIGASKSLLKHGTTSFLPTSLTSSDEDLFLFLNNVREARKEKAGRILGVHLEGPYFSPSMSGAQDKRYMINPTPSHYMKILEKGEGLIKRWSLAPELPGALELIDVLVKNSILVSGAHTDAEYSQIVKAHERGMKLLTHFYSGMSGIKRVGGFRVLGTIEAGYMLSDLYLELILDSMHLPPELLSMIFKLKGMDRLIGCSDSMRGAGMGEGPSVLGPINNGLEVIIEDGIAKVMDKSCFAGSVATGERLINTLVNIMGLEPHVVSRLLSLVPSVLVGEEENIGSIKEGKYGDLLLLDKNYKLENVILGGKLVEREE